MNDSKWSFWDVVDSLRQRDGRFRREAYGFVVAALGATVEALPPARLSDPERRHLTGQELVQGVVALARREFGPLAPMVFREWGVTRSEDIGAMVFQLVEANQLSARPEDTLDDFRDAGDLLESLGESPGSGAPPVDPAARPGRAE